MAYMNLGEPVQILENNAGDWIYHDVTNTVYWIVRTGLSRINLVAHLADPAVVRLVPFLTS